MSWPKTSVPIPEKLKAPDCETCAPGYDLLIGPGREVLASHVFTVSDKQVVLRAAGLSAFPDATVTLEMEMMSCGEQVFEPFVCNGARVVLTGENNAATVTASGRYRVVLAGAEPADVWVSQTPTETGTGLGVGTYREKG